MRDESFGLFCRDDCRGTPQDERMVLLTDICRDSENVSSSSVLEEVKSSKIASSFCREWCFKSKSLTLGQSSVLLFSPSS